MSSTPTPLHNDTSTLIHRTTVVLSQVQNLLRQATDIVAHLHTHFLHHIHQADPTFRQHFQPLPTPPIHPIRLPSTTSSCDSAPSRPPTRLPAPLSKDSDDTPTTPPAPQPTTTRKRKQPLPPPLNQQADWDAWDGDADCRLVELKENPRLRPNWTTVARRVGFSVEQCQARWQELKDMQRQQDQQLSSTPLPTEPPRQAPSLSPTPTSPAVSPAPHSQPDFPLPPKQRHRLHHIDHFPLLCCCRRPLSENLVRTVIRRNLHLRPLAVISYDPFHPAFSTACRRTNPLTCTDNLFFTPSLLSLSLHNFGLSVFRLTLAPQLFVRHFVLLYCTNRHGQSSRSPPWQHRRHRTLPATAPSELAPTFDLHSA